MKHDLPQRMTYTVTAPGMTRFVMTLAECVEFVLKAVETIRGGEVFVLKLPAVSLETIAASVSWPLGPNIEYTGLRPGEKMHEALISQHESARTRDRGWGYSVAPITDTRGVERPGERLPEGFEFRSDTTTLLSIDEFRLLAGLTEREAA